ncbi:MAG: hypothetical protein ACRC6I_05240 [Paracoccaceae bacterium]
MKAISILFAIFLATATAAQTLEDEPWIDFDLLFEQNADAITPDTDQDGNPTAVLNLPGEVRVIRRGTAGGYSYCTSDISDQGPTGDLMVIMVSLQLTAQRCSGFATSEQMTEIDALLARLGPYFAENTFPPQTWPALQQQLISLMPADRQASCTDAMNEDGWLKGFLRNILDEDFEADTERLFATPKLPVLSGCR